MALDNFPYKLLQENIVLLSFHMEVIESLKKTSDFDKIISSNKILSNMPIPDARKEVAKAIYATGRQPEINKNGHSTKEVMGSVGEALTELLIPGNYVAVNNAGYDVDYSGNYIEVKSTITEKVTMSNKQYLTADYLIVHRFNKDTNKHRSSLLVPLDIIHAFKPNRKKSVSISTKTDEWARGFTITLPRIVRFFNMLKTNENHPVKNGFCQFCHSEIVKNNIVDFRALAVSCDNNCVWGFWEERYFYYKYFYSSKSSTPTATTLTKCELENTFHCIYLPESSLHKETTLKEIFIEVSTLRNRCRIYFCPSMRNTKADINVDDIKVLPQFLELLKKLIHPLKTIMEFEVILYEDKVSLMVRGHKGGAKPGFFYGEYPKGEEPDALSDLLKEMDL